MVSYILIPRNQILITKNTHSNLKTTFSQWWCWCGNLKWVSNAPYFIFSGPTFFLCLMNPIRDMFWPEFSLVTPRIIKRAKYTSHISALSKLQRQETKEETEEEMSVHCRTYLELPHRKDLQVLRSINVKGSFQNGAEEVNESQHTNPTHAV